jgi:4-amino-4-deoxy-L-arabinose transferase-like glycosyltransferase
LDKRWINPDEGAHLMDAVLILDGKIPAVEFDSRQPIYAYANAAVLKLFGVNYTSGRLLPLTCSVLVGCMVFLMALMLFDSKVAILSAVIYWLLPLEVINSVVVKTEPLVLLLTCLSLSAVIFSSHSNRPAWFIAAGIFAAMGFYVRQSALIIPLTVFGYLLIQHRSRFREIAKRFGFFLAGYAGVVSLVLIYYSQFMGFEEFLLGDLSPLGFLASAGKKLLSLIGFPLDSSSVLASQTPEVSHKNYRLYYRYIRFAFSLHSFLFLGLGFSIITLSRQVISGNKPQIKEYLGSHSLLYLWVFSLLIAYTYFYYTGKFYIDYFREFLPPLVIIFSAWLRRAVPAFDRNEFLERFVMGGLCVSAIAFVAESYFKENLGAGIMVCLALALFTLFYFAEVFESTIRRLVFWFSFAALIVIIALSRQTPLISYLSGIGPKFFLIGAIIIIPLALLTKGSRPTLKEYVRFMAFFVVLGAFALNLTYSANRLTLAYDSVWSPVSLEKTSAYLKDNTQSNDRVMSGAVIWELQAQRKPFLDISHPLSFKNRIQEKDRKNLEAAIRTHPPEVIILDSYTERTYFKQVTWLRDFLSSRYNLVLTAEPARHPVEVYQLKDSL